MSLKSVLIVDDEYSILTALNYFIKMSLNLPCEIFSNPVNALESFNDEPQKYSVIISDYNMPELNGLELFKKVREIDKNIPFIMISGANGKVFEKDKIKITNELNIPILEKPFEVVDLFETIKSAVR